MGDIADMMLDGDLCEGCGVFIGGAGSGFPRRCASCKRDNRSSLVKHTTPKNAAKVACRDCGRHVKAAGLADHQRDKHGSAATVEAPHEP